MHGRVLSLGIVFLVPGMALLVLGKCGRSRYYAPQLIIGERPHPFINKKRVKASGRAKTTGTTAGARTSTSTAAHTGAAAHTGTTSATRLENWGW